MGIFAVFSRLTKFFGSTAFTLLKLPYQIISKIFGPFVAFFLYIPMMLIVFGVFIKLFEQEVVDKSPWNSMTLFHTLPYEERQELIDMTEMASFVYLDANAWGNDLTRLQDKGYFLLEKPNLNDGGLTYALMSKADRSLNSSNLSNLEVTNTIYILFRGSTTLADALDDSQMIFSDEQLEHMGRFTVALRVTRELLGKYPKHHFVLVGHSLGGATVQYVLKHMSSSRLKGYTVNPIGLPGKIGTIPENRLVDIVHEADIAQTIMLDSRLVGRGILVRGKFTQQSDGTWTPDFSLLNSASQHSVNKTLKNMIAQHTGSYIPPSNNQLPQPEPGGIRAPVKTNFREALGDTL